MVIPLKFKSPIFASIPTLIYTHRMAKYLHKCSTNAFEVVLMYRVALSFIRLTTSFILESFDSCSILGCNLKTISISCDVPPLVLRSPAPEVVPEEPD